MALHATSGALNFTLEAGRHPSGFTTHAMKAQCKPWLADLSYSGSVPITPRSWYILSVTQHVLQTNGIQGTTPSTPTSNAALNRSATTSSDTEQETPCCAVTPKHYTTQRPRHVHTPIPHTRQAPSLLQGTALWGPGCKGSCVPSHPSTTLPEKAQFQCVLWTCRKQGQEAHSQTQLWWQCAIHSVSAVPNTQYLAPGQAPADTCTPAHAHTRSRPRSAQQYSDNRSALRL